MVVRDEHPCDRAAVRAVSLSAFGTSAHADLVDALREQGQAVVLLVAEADGELVGHILFSPVTLGGHPELRLMGLAPMAVAPAQQRRGIGSALVRAGLERCRQLGIGAVVVLGHPSYYPRFGFQRSARFGIRSEFDAPDEAFMLIELQPECLQGASGIVRYHAVFKEV